MNIYPERPAAILRQAAADLFAAAWVYAWIRIAVWAHHVVEMLAAPGVQVERLADDLAGNLRGAGEAIGGVPLIGDQVTGPLVRAADAARSIAEAGREQQQWVHEAAYTIPLLLLILPLGLVLLGWLPRRVRRVRRTRAVAGLRATADGLDLLALRALATRPVAEIAAAGPGIAEGWRRGDARAVATLAALELRRAGLKVHDGRGQAATDTRLRPADFAA